MLLSTNQFVTKFDNKIDLMDIYIRFQELTVCFTISKIFNKNVSQKFWLNLKVVCKVSKSHSTMILVQYRKLLVLDLRKILQFLLHHSFQYSQRFYIASMQIRICSRDIERFVFHDGCVHSFLPDPWSLPPIPLVPGLQSVMHNICNVFSYLANVWVAVVLPCTPLQ